MRPQKIWTIEMEMRVADLLKEKFAMVHLIVPEDKHEANFEAWGYRTRAAREEALVTIARLLPSVWGGSELAATLGINSYYGRPG